MPVIEIDNAVFHYEVSGADSQIIYTPGGFAGVRTVESLLGRAAREYAIIGWDRRNCGSSDVIFDESVSEWHAWADDLARFIVRIGRPPVVLGGFSAGTLVSLLCAVCHPELVKGLFLIQPPSDIPEDWKMIARERYLNSAEAAESGGMEAVASYQSGWFAEWPQLIAANPRNRGRLLAQNPDEFIKTMKRWAAWHDTGKAHTAGLGAAELLGIKAQTLIIPGTDKDHPLRTARWLHEHIQGSELVVMQEWFPDLTEEIYNQAVEDEVCGFLADLQSA